MFFFYSNESGLDFCNDKTGSRAHLRAKSVKCKDCVGSCVIGLRAICLLALPTDCLLLLKSLSSTGSKGETLASFVSADKVGLYFFFFFHINYKARLKIEPTGKDFLSAIQREGSCKWL